MFGSVLCYRVIILLLWSAASALNSRHQSQSCKIFVQPRSNHDAWTCHCVGTPWCWWCSRDLAPQDRGFTRKKSTSFKVGRCWQLDDFGCAFHSWCNLGCTEECSQRWSFRVLPCYVACKDRRAAVNEIWALQVCYWWDLKVRQTQNLKVLLQHPWQASTSFFDWPITWCVAWCVAYPPFPPQHETGSASSSWLWGCGFDSARERLSSSLSDVLQCLGDNH